MLIGLIILLLLFLTVLAVRLHYLGRLMQQLAQSVDARRPFLIEKRNPITRTYGFEKLHLSVMRLLEENLGLEQKERGQLSQIEATLGKIQEAVLIVDSDNRIVMVNHALQEMVGQSRDLAGEYLESCLRSADFLAYVSQIRTGKELPKAEIEFDFGNKPQFFEVTGTKIPDSESLMGNRLTLFVLHDITRLKGLERMRSDFVANVSHELRTPVTIIKGFADTLAEEHETLPPESRERFLYKIQKNVSRLQRLLEDLLTLTRLESGPESITTNVYDMNDLVRDVTDNFEARLLELGKSLILELSDDDTHVRVDSLKITQVLDNVIDNAVRHARGFTTLTIRTIPKGKVLRCEVSDDGCGIPERDAPFIFQRFYRVDKGRSRDSGGTGLGLSIVKHIIQQHDGEVSVSSEAGQGTTIRIDLPRAPIGLSVEPENLNRENEELFVTK